MIQGAMGQGKTSSLVQLMCMLDQAHAFDIVYYFSPTARLDDKARLLIEGRHKYLIKAYEDFALETWKSCVDETKSLLSQYREYQRISKVYQKFVKGNCNVEALSMDENLLLYERDYQPPKPPFKHGKVPSFCFIFDDLVGHRELYAATPRGPVAKWLLMSRHLKTSIIFLVQTWHNTLNRQLRNQVSVYILFSNKSLSLKRQIAEELSAYCSVDELVKLWDAATENKYDFLLIDVRNREAMFRRNFDEVLTIE